MNTGENIGREQLENTSERCGQAFFEIIDCVELARRLAVPATWVRDHVRSRSADPIPCLRFGKYVRFQWASPELQLWIARHKTKSRKTLVKSFPVS
jgi:hypothetical protein